MMYRLALVALALLASACSASSGGGGGPIAYTVGTSCSASMITDQCGAGPGHAAIVHCTNAVWVSVKDCASGEGCAVKNGAPTCLVATSSGADATSGNDGFVFDAVTTPSDVQNGTDAQEFPDVQIPIDTWQPADVPKDTGKDIGKDISKDIKLDTGPAAATWGTCALSDSACLKTCEPANCAKQGAACQNDLSCATYQSCSQGCAASPIQMPSQTGTPIPQNSGETQQDYCYRVCQVQAGTVGMALDESYVECVIGLCVDCANSGGITQAQCQSACALENYCATEYDNCLQDSDCLSFYGCIVTAADQTAQNACASNTTSGAQSLFTSLNDCLKTNGTKCVAP